MPKNKLTTFEEISYIMDMHDVTCPSEIDNCTQEIENYINSLLKEQQDCIKIDLPTRDEIQAESNRRKQEDLKAHHLLEFNMTSFKEGVNWVISFFKDISNDPQQAKFRDQRLRIELDNWISVKSELPPFGVEIMFCNNKTGRVFYGERRFGNKLEQQMRGVWNWVDYRNKKNRKNVTDWMPLPCTPMKVNQKIRVN
jgi:hypothetical protein